MTVFFHELKRARLSLMIWSAAISFMLAVSVFIYPEMKDQMAEMNDMLASMGAFSEAFGMDSLSFESFVSYFAVECGSTLLLGGAIFAAIIGVSALSKEERDRTAEFLLTHPISRGRVFIEKLLSVAAQIVILNLAVFTVTLLSAFAIGESADLTTLILLFASYLILQAEIAAISFSVSAVLVRGGMGIAIGVSVGAYFLNLIANMTEDARVLKYFTPFAYTEGADIIADKGLSCEYVAIGVLVGLTCLALAFWRYRRKDIQ